MGNNPLLYFDLSGRDFLGVDVPGVVGDTWENTGGALWDESAGARTVIGIAGDGNGGWLGEAPGFVGDRTQDLVKHINLSTEELIAAGGSSLGGAAFCGIAGIGAGLAATPAVGIAANRLCVAIEAIGIFETATDILDEDNGIWTEELFE